MATTPNTIGIRGTVAEVAYAQTKSGKQLMEMVVDVVSPYKGQDYHDFYPVCFWESRIPKRTVEKGDFVDVEFRIGGSRGSTGKCFVNLTGVKCEVVEAAATRGLPQNEVEAAGGGDAGEMPF